ncbi:MAG: tRNA (adenosine(37)-N6)-threonylcarbamoyltransferase complex dimerization subunit type 1 TsaB [Kiritimatiellia bacterium]
MILLALETSSGLESAALLDDRTVLASASWAATREHARLFFDALRQLLAEQALTPDRVDAFAVGLGPGSFTGLRMALSAAQGLALPGNKPLFGLPSAEAAAAEAARETGRSRILVCGDGRRQRIWSGLFEKRGELFELAEDWHLDPISELTGRLPGGGALCTADWDALAAPLREAAAGKNVRLLERPLFPSAQTLGRLAFERLSRGQPSQPLSPIYLHPPVFIPPSFPVEEDEPLKESP